MVPAVPHSQRLDITVTDSGIVTILGDVDSDTSTHLETYLAGLEATSDLVLDLRGVEFMDSSGLRTVIAMHQRHVDAGSTLRIHGMSAPVRRLFDITGVVELIEIID